mmetsp:Transcript_9729/g.14816  ORF Transcript_9729/g.14816 Transcript_9729/m.14816 type:complete len:122 (+) Transcript_9729:557-922(+)
MLTLLCCGSALASFHFSTLEEYYTGGLFLGPFNGISDGSVAIYGIFLTMFLFSNNFWTWEVIERNDPNDTIRVVDLAIYATIIGQAGIVLLCFKNIFAHQKKPKQEGDIHGEPFVLKNFII